MRTLVQHSHSRLPSPLLFLRTRTRSTLADSKLYQSALHRAFASSSSSSFSSSSSSSPSRTFHNQLRSRRFLLSMTNSSAPASAVSFSSVAASSSSSSSSSPSSSSSMPVRALLFDVDGTMSDTDLYHRLVFKDILMPFSIDCDDHFYNVHISGKSNRNLHQELVPHLTVEQATQLFIDKETHFREVAQAHLQPLRGLLRFMQSCRENGVKIAAVTNAPHPNVVMMLSKFGLMSSDDVIGKANTKGGFVKGPTGSLDTIVLGDDCTHAKPHPEAYLTAMKRLNFTADQCVVFEDSSSGVQAGVAAGCRVIGICTTKTPEAMLAMGCVAAIHHYDQLVVQKLLAGAPPSEFVKKEAE